MDVAAYLRTVTRAEASTAAGNWAKALVLWQSVVEHNPVNGNHWDRLAQACVEWGDYRAALTAAERARELGVWDGSIDTRDTIWPGEVDYRVAACHARLGHTEQAMAELARALRAGLRDLDRVRTDDTWQALRDHERFRALVGVDVPELSRDAGWRSDLELFGREVKRRAVDPFRHRDEADFDAELAALDRRIPESTDAEIWVALLRIVGSLRDGHASVMPPDDDTTLRQTLPVEFYRFAEGVFVTGTAPAHRQLLGAQVLAVDGRPVDDVLTALEPLLCRDNDYRLTALGPRWLRHPPVLHALDMITAPDTVRLTVLLMDGTTDEIRVDADLSVPGWTSFPRPDGWVWLSSSEPQPRYLRNRDIDCWFEYLAEHRTVYLQLNTVTSHPTEPLPDFTDRMFDFIDDHDVHALVIDLRWNAGGNTSLTQPLLHRLIGCRKINRRGALFVVIGRETFSAAQNTATSIERHTNAIFVGEPSGSSPNFVGELVPFHLPHSGFRVNVSDLHWQTSWPIDRRAWIAPEIYAPPTFADHRADRDPALEAILDYTEHLPHF